MAGWHALDIPTDSAGFAVITGTGGIGYEDALALARAGWDVTIAGRNPEKGADAVARLGRACPGAKVRFERVDLADLGSIEAFGSRMLNGHERLDLLINNAAVMAPPKRQTTKDGLELQFGTNHLGHFALTAALLPLLRNAAEARVVTVSSIAARSGAIDFGDLQSERAYKPMAAYGQSKLANLLFAFELQRRSDAAGWGVSSIAAHPGISRTDLMHNAPGRRSVMGIARSALWFLFQPAARGALPTLFAATSPDAADGGYYGPDRWRETRGGPAPAMVPRRALDADTAAVLWDASERLSGHFFPDASGPSTQTTTEAINTMPWRPRRLA